MLAHAVAAACSPLGLREYECRFGGALSVASRSETVPSTLDLIRACFGAKPADPAVPEEQLGIVGREREGFRVVAVRRGKGVQRRRTIAGSAERLQCMRREFVDILTGRPRQLERRGVVVGEHLGVVLGTPERLDPRRRLDMPPRAIGARDLAVCHVAHQQVPECVLRLAFH